MTTRTTSRRSSRKRSSRKRSSRKRSTATRRRTARSRRRSRSGLPAWSDLDGSAKRPGIRRAVGRALDIAPSLRFGLMMLLLFAAMTFYVGHVYSTQRTLAELQEARAENERLHLRNQRLRSVYDHMTGPSAVMQAATEAGLVEGVTYGPTLRLSD